MRLNESYQSTEKVTSSTMSILTKPFGHDNDSLIIFSKLKILISSTATSHLLPFFIANLRALNIFTAIAVEMRYVDYKKLYEARWFLSRPSYPSHASMFGVMQHFRSQRVLYVPLLRLRSLNEVKHFYPESIWVRKGMKSMTKL